MLYGLWVVDGGVEGQVRAMAAAYRCVKYLFMYSLGGGFYVSLLGVIG